MNQRRKVITYVDAICGSGKSTTLQHYIKSSLLTNSEAIPPRYLLVMPNMNYVDCCGQLKLATALEFFQYRFSDSFGGNPPLYSCGLSAL